MLNREDMHANKPRSCPKMKRKGERESVHRGEKEKGGEEEKGRRRMTWEWKRRRMKGHEMRGAELEGGSAQGEERRNGEKR